MGPSEINALALPTTTTDLNLGPNAGGGDTAWGGKI